MSKENKFLEDISQMASSTLATMVSLKNDLASYIKDNITLALNNMDVASKSDVESLKEAISGLQEEVRNLKEASSMRSSRPRSSDRPERSSRPRGEGEGRGMYNRSGERSFSDRGPRTGFSSRGPGSRTRSDRDGGSRTRTDRDGGNRTNTLRRREPQE